MAPDSNVETYVAMRLEIDNWRWAGVPFYIRTGKHMSQRNTEIAIRFKQAPYAAFQDTPVDTLRPNWLVLRIAPDEGISLQFEVKRRGPVVELAAVKMDFHYDDWFPKEPNVGYETLLYDVMIGDPTLFMRADMVEQTWRIVQPVLDAWAAEKADFPDYDFGSDGPKAADELLARERSTGLAPVSSAIGAEAMSGQHGYPSSSRRCGWHASHQGQGADLRGRTACRARRCSGRHRLCDHQRPAAARHERC